MRYERPVLPALPEAAQLPGVRRPVWRLRAPERALPTPRGDLLFHTPSDPGQEHDLATEHPEQIAKLAVRLSEHMQRLAVPEEQLRRERL